MSFTQTHRSGSARRVALGGAVALVGAGVMLGSVAGSASAKELASGGGTGAAVTTCDPVTSLTYKGDARAGETGLASIAVSYGVKPCNKNQAVTVDAKLYLSADPAAVAYDDPAAALSGKFAVYGVKANTSYIAKITVTDVATGVVVGSKSIYAAAIYKGV